MHTGRRIARTVKSLLPRLISTRLLAMSVADCGCFWAMSAGNKNSRRLFALDAKMTEKHSKTKVACGHDKSAVSCEKVRPDIQHM